jgi:cytochrome c553
MSRAALHMAVVALVLIAIRVVAQPSPAASAANATPAEALAQGAALATQGGAGIAPCTSCHGGQGEGNAAAGFPRLVGQSAAYLLRQLDAYASDLRTNAVMQPIAKAMTPAQRAAAAAYYESLLRNATATAAGASAPRSNAAAAGSAGKTLATVGAESRNLQACANCHGPDGIGEWATYPALAGQHASYLTSALAEWKSGARRTDPSGQMPRIAKLLSDAEASAVVAYYAALPPPAPQSIADASGARANTPARATIVSGPTRAGQAGTTQGVGTEQGAPLSGGTQGVGSAGNPTGPQSGAPSGGTTAAPPARAGAASAAR